MFVCVGGWDGISVIEHMFVLYRERVIEKYSSEYSLNRSLSIESDLCVLGEAELSSSKRKMKENL